MRGVLPCGCYKCPACKINRTRMWKARCIAEYKDTGKGSFLTLTYSDEHLPKNGSLCPEHVTNFVKRLRNKVIGGLRYYYVGEYGDVRERPHYHMLLFGHTVDSICDDTGQSLRQVVDSEWKYGHVYYGTMTVDSVGYTVGYLNKRKFFKNDPNLRGRHKEYARMSRKPALGS